MSNLEAYQEILSVLNKYDHLLDNDYSIDIRQRLNDRIRLQEISDLFGINLKPDCNPNWCRISEYESIGIYGADHNRTISWSDDGSQPENEILYVIIFSTGAYIFGDSYPTNTFNDFFVELISYGPKYVDSHNHCLYFSNENAANVHNNFRGILEKYRLKVKDELKIRKIQNLKDELEKLENN